MYPSASDTKQNSRAVRATEDQREMLMLSYKTSPSPSKAELALLSFQTNLDMEWINRWFMRQRAAERRRTAPPKPTKPASYCIDLTVKHELVDAQGDVHVASGTLPTGLGLQVPASEEEEDPSRLPGKQEESDDASSTHIPSSPTRYSVASSLPPSSSPPSSPAPHTVKSPRPAPSRAAAANPTLRLFRALPYEDSRARFSSTSEVPAPGEDASSLPSRNHGPDSVPRSAYMRCASRRPHPYGSAAIPTSATLSTGRPSASTNVLIAPMPTRPQAFNPYLPRGTTPALLPASAPPSSWQQYLSAQASTVQQARPATPGKTDATVQHLDAPATPATKAATAAESVDTTPAAVSPAIQEMLPLLNDLEREMDIAKIAQLLAELRRLGLQW